MASGGKLFRCAPGFSRLSRLFHASLDVFHSETRVFAVQPTRNIRRIVPPRNAVERNEPRRTASLRLR